MPTFPNIFAKLQAAATEAQGVIANFTGGSLTIAGGATFVCVPASEAQVMAIRTTGFGDTSTEVVAITKAQFGGAEAPWVSAPRVKVTRGGRTFAVVAYNHDELHYVVTLKPIDEPTDE